MPRTLDPWLSLRLWPDPSRTPAISLLVAGPLLDPYPDPAGRTPGPLIYRDLRPPFPSRC